MHISFHTQTARDQTTLRLNRWLPTLCPYGSHVRLGCAEVSPEEWGLIADVPGIVREQCPYHTLPRVLLQCACCGTRLITCTDADCTAVHAPTRQVEACGVCTATGGTVVLEHEV